MKLEAALLVCVVVFASLAVVNFSTASGSDWTGEDNPSLISPAASSDFNLSDVSLNLLLELESTGRCHIRVDYSGANPLNSLVGSLTNLVGTGATGDQTSVLDDQTSGGTGGAGNTEVATATSLSFDMSMTYVNQTITTNVEMKNVGASNMKAYEEVTVAGQTYKMIMDFGTNGLWMDYGSGWQDYSSMLGDQGLQTYSSQFNDWISQLSGWSGSGDYTYTDSTTGATVTISNIQVNPDIPDSVFQASTNGDSLSASPASSVYNSISASSTQSFSWDIEIDMDSASGGAVTATASGWVVLPLPEDTKELVSTAIAAYNVAPAATSQLVLQQIQNYLESSSYGLQVTDLDISQLSWDSAASRLTFTVAITATGSTFDQLENELPLTITTSGSGGLPTTTSGLGDLSDMTLDALLRIVSNTVAAELQVNLAGTSATMSFDLDFALWNDELGLVTMTDNTLVVDFGVLSGLLPISSTTSLGDFDVTFTLRVPSDAVVEGLPDGYTQSGSDYTWTGSHAVSAVINLITGESGTKISYYVGPASVSVEDITSSIGHTIMIDNNSVDSVDVESEQAVSVNFERTLPVSRIRVRLSSGARSFDVQAQQLSERPAEVTDVPSGHGLVGYYMRIETGARVDNATVEFKVPKLWIRVNGVDNASVRLLRYHNGEWNELDTTLLSDDENDVYFSAETPGFSVFAVAATPTQPFSGTLPLYLVAAAAIVLIVVTLVIIMVYLSRGRKIR